MANLKLMDSAKQFLHVHRSSSQICFNVPSKQEPFQKSTSEGYSGNSKLFY